MWEKPAGHPRQLPSRDNRGSGAGRSPLVLAVVMRKAREEGSQLCLRGCQAGLGRDGPFC